MATKKNNIHIAIVASNFNRNIVDRLYSGAISTLEKNGINEDKVKVVRVPGAFEIPVTVKSLLDKKQYNAIITLGVIIRGETPHFEYISNACAHGISQLAINSGTPIIFGVLTVDNKTQAEKRSNIDPMEKNKGSEAAQAALDMVDLDWL
ncbi:MAG: 6,7-dimethyl-8-ribityllumazine synthase [Legionellales bacterium]|nr:6,7-dimethyl-8-ribityllumazine synthase [Legionellales bacterium]